MTNETNRPTGESSNQEGFPIERASVEGADVNSLADALASGPALFHIESKYSGKCLDLSLADGPDTVNGTNVFQWDFNRGDNQKWILTKQADGSYQIKSKHSGKCLDLSLLDGPDTVNGTNVFQWDWNGGDNQKWIFTQQADGSYQITSKHSGKCLDLSLADGPDTVNGTNVFQWDWEGADNQKWILRFSK
jgi:hypothetical protein